MSFFNRNKDRMTVTIVVVILIVMIGVTSSKRISLSNVENFTGNILTPIGKWTNKISHNVSDFFADLRNMPALNEENKELKKKIVELEDENRRYEDIIGKTDYLKKEDQLLRNTKLNLLASQIVGKEPGNWFDRFTIDKGLKDGVKKGDTVVQAIEIEQGIIVEGIVGRIIDVGDNWSKTVTVVDELSRLAFKITRTQDGGVISGGLDLDGQIKGYLFDHKSDIIKGDKIMTSGLGEVYEKDIYVGEVVQVTSDDNDLMKEILVKPAIDFKKLYKVYIIVDNDEG